MRKLAILLAVAIVAMTAVSANAAGLVGELGILDLEANGGINPNTGNAWQAGDQYRLAFHTAGKFHADNADASFYNLLVTAEAQLNQALAGSTWTAMISTEATNVKVNTGTDNDGGVPVYAMDGTTCIAKDNADIWDGWSNPFAVGGDNTIRIPVGTGPVPASQNVYYSPFLDQYGLGDSGDVHGVTVWTGTNPGGSTHPTQPVGSTVGTPEGATGTTQWGSSNANRSGRVWQRGNSNNTTTELSFYALSDPLTVMDAAAAKIVFPADGAAKIAPDAAMTLEWIDPDPNGAGSVYAEVFFGTDPCTLSQVTTDPVDGLDVTTTAVDTSVSDTYFWRVDITIGDANTVEGEIWSFTTVADALPIVVIDPLKIMTWSDKAVQLNATIDDNGEGDVTFIWTASPDGSADENLTVDFDPGVEDPIVTVTNNTGSMVTVTMTLTVTDANGDIQKTANIEVYSDACDMTLNGEKVPVAISDLNADCKTNIADLAIMAAAWLDDYTSTEPK